MAAKCAFCGLGNDRELELGLLFTSDAVVAHNFCMLFSSGLAQNGEDEEGINGFLSNDIFKEIRRGKKLKCVYCKKIGATVGCYSNRCKKSYHLPCGLDNFVLLKFNDDFQTGCIVHRSYQEGNGKGEGTECPICMETFVADPKVAVWASCCKRKSWFHKLCMQKLAWNAGYFLKCPLCNDSATFIEDMKNNGIHVPEQDASWELEPNAFSELLERHIRCDAKICQCPKGRSYDGEGTQWEVLLCDLCGSSGMHVTCGKMAFACTKWECEDCLAMLQKEKAHVVKVGRGKRTPIGGTKLEDELRVGEIDSVTAEIGRAHTSATKTPVNDSETICQRQKNFFKWLNYGYNLEDNEVLNGVGPSSLINERLTIRELEEVGEELNSQLDQLKRQSLADLAKMNELKLTETDIVRLAVKLHENMETGGSDERLDKADLYRYYRQNLPAYRMRQIHIRLSVVFAYRHSNIIHAISASKKSKVRPLKSPFSSNGMGNISSKCSRSPFDGQSGNSKSPFEACKISCVSPFDAQMGNSKSPFEVKERNLKSYFIEGNISQNFLLKSSFINGQKGNSDNVTSESPLDINHSQHLSGTSPLKFSTDLDPNAEAYVCKPIPRHQVTSPIHILSRKKLEFPKGASEKTEGFLGFGHLTEKSSEEVPSFCPFTRKSSNWTTVRNVNKKSDDDKNNSILQFKVSNCEARKKSAIRGQKQKHKRKRAPWIISFQKKTKLETKVNDSVHIDSELDPFLWSPESRIIKESVISDKTLLPKDTNAIVFSPGNFNKERTEGMENQESCTLKCNNCPEADLHQPLQQVTEIRQTSRKFRVPKLNEVAVCLKKLEADVCGMQTIDMKKIDISKLDNVPVNSISKRRKSEVNNLQKNKLVNFDPIKKEKEEAEVQLHAIFKRNSLNSQCDFFVSSSTEAIKPEPQEEGMKTVKRRKSKARKLMDKDVKAIVEDGDDKPEAFQDSQSDLLLSNFTEAVKLEEKDMKTVKQRKSRAKKLVDKDIKAVLEDGDDKPVTFQDSQSDLLLSNFTEAVKPEEKDMKTVKRKKSKAMKLVDKDIKAVTKDGINKPVEFPDGQSVFFLSDCTKTIKPEEKSMKTLKRKRSRAKILGDKDMKAMVEDGDDKPVAFQDSQNYFFLSNFTDAVKLEEKDMKTVKQRKSRAKKLVDKDIKAVLEDGDDKPVTFQDSQSDLLLSNFTEAVKPEEKDMKTVKRKKSKAMKLVDKDIKAVTKDGINKPVEFPDGQSVFFLSDCTKTIKPEEKSMKTLKRKRSRAKILGDKDMKAMVEDGDDKPVAFQDSQNYFFLSNFTDAVKPEEKDMKTVKQRKSRAKKLVEKYMNAVTEDGINKPVTFRDSQSDFLASDCTKTIKPEEKSMKTMKGRRSKAKKLVDKDIIVVAEDGDDKPIESLECQSVKTQKLSATKRKYNKSSKDKQKYIQKTLTNFFNRSMSSSE